MYFYIYAHMDKFKIATLARLKHSPDVRKRDKSCRMSVERNITMLITGRFRSRARQPKSSTCIKFHSATTRRKEKTYRGSWKKNWTLSGRLETMQITKIRTSPPLRYFGYGKESDFMSNLIYIHNEFSNAAWRSRILLS